MASDLAIQIIATVLLVSAPTAIVYWRNRGQLSVGKSYLRGLLHFFRALGWGAVVLGSIFAVLSGAALVGVGPGGNWPWWSIFFSLAFVGIGYGTQRLMRFILNDADWNNMFASKDR